MKLPLKRPPLRHSPSHYLTPPPSSLPTAFPGLGNLAGLTSTDGGMVRGSEAIFLSASVGSALGALTGITPLIITAESAVRGWESVHWARADRSMGEHSAVWWGCWVCGEVVWLCGRVGPGVRAG